MPRHWACSLWRVESSRQPRSCSVNNCRRTLFSTSCRRSEGGHGLPTRHSKPFHIPRALKAFTEVNTGPKLDAGGKRGRGTAGHWDVGFGCVTTPNGRASSFQPRSRSCPMTRMAELCTACTRSDYSRLEARGSRLEACQPIPTEYSVAFFSPSSEDAFPHAGSSRCFAVVSHYLPRTRNRRFPRVHPSFTPSAHAVIVLPARQQHPSQATTPCRDE